jgi:hypothetical protein
MKTKKLIVISINPPTQYQANELINKINEILKGRQIKWKRLN